VRKPKILLYDIETTPNVAYTWGKYDQNVLDFVKERELLCFAYKWYGGKEVHFAHRKNERTDKRLVKVLGDLLSQADISVAHNGDEFDRKILKSRMLYHRLSPLAPGSTVDTKKVAKRYFNFNGNSLDDLLRFLGHPRKLSNPGISLWLGCLASDKESWGLMERYNRRDVQGLDLVYTDLLPWIESHPNTARLLHPDAFNAPGSCPADSSHQVVKRGFYATAAMVKQRWACKTCGKWFLTRVVK
jgi:hypothetical protein